MVRHKLDSIDLKILAELQADGRMTNVDLAEKAASPRPPACAGCEPSRRPVTFAAITQTSILRPWLRGDGVRLCRLSKPAKPI